MVKEVKLKSTFEEIIKLIEENSRVLDLGCGDGELLHQLMERKNIYGLGIEINTEEVLKCIKKGVSVIQEDIDEGLDEYHNETYDYVILSETLQTVKRPDYVLNQIVRIGKKAIVSFPNYAHLSTRLQIIFLGKTPKTKILPYEWYNTPNIHLLSIKDFKEFCRKNDIKILKEMYFTSSGKKIFTFGLENLLAEEAVFLIQKKELTLF